jgi:hypothetical protein
MADGTQRVFISYRRDDAAGYAGRLEEALEKRLGRGSVFRDLQDIAPGEDFAKVIADRLRSAAAVVVLIGPRWAGADANGTRRIDDARDFVRLEVGAALASGARVLPLLLPGAGMPAQDTLPGPLQPLARFNAMSLTDTHWDADIDRLAAALGLSRPRAVWPWALGGAALAAAAVATACWMSPRGDAGRSAAAAASAAGADPVAPAVPAASVPAPQPDAGARVLGRWSADVRYDWGARHTERFEFKRHAGEITGTATFLAYPRGIESLQVDGMNLRFETRSQESAGDKLYDLVHHYGVELRGQPPDEVLAIRMHTTGGFGGSRKPLEFEARRAAGTP